MTSSPSRVHAIEAADGRHVVLDLALVEVSGNGVDAGSRALLLSGALRGLLGAVPPENFLHLVLLLVVIIWQWALRTS